MVYYRRNTMKKSPYRPRKTIRKKRAVGNKLARFNFSRKRYSANRKFSSGINKFAENHLLQCFRQNEISPIPIQLGAIATYRLFCFGSVPATWDTDAIDIAGASITQGTGEGQRAGNYVYLKNTTINMEIDMNRSTTNLITPTEFRVIVFKQRRAVMPAGISFNPATSLYLDEVGQQLGYATAGFNGTDAIMQPLNKRDYIILQDKNFVLSNPHSTSYGGYSGHYPTLKRMRLSLPHWIRAHYNNTSSLPDTYDYHYGILVIARSQAKDTSSNTFEINMRGSTSFTDL